MRARKRDDLGRDSQVRAEVTDIPIGNVGKVHHSAYFVPSNAVPCDFEWTSKTLPPPQLCESGSSCTDCRFHSGRPVMGSTGIRRRNRVFCSPLAPYCTP